MSGPWDVLAVRARGLSTGLLNDGTLDELARPTDGRRLGALLRSTAYAPFLPPRDEGPEALDRAVAVSVAARLALLARWAGPDAGALAPIFLGVDLANVRTLARAAVGGMSSEWRLAATVPTPSLDRAALVILAGAETVASIGATLVAWGHPLGPPLLAGGTGAGPDLFRMELELARTHVAEALASSGARVRAVRDDVRDSIASANVVTSLLLAGVDTDSPADTFYVDGGVAPDRATFVRAASAPSRADAVMILGDALRATPFGAVLARSSGSPVGLPGALLQARLAAMERERRVHPLSPATVLLFVHRLRSEAVALRRAVWTSVRIGDVP